ncbi:MAG: aminotransferase class I/II-fold pyridoxal phosphate-dependent enzyme [Thermoplasmata archaeon]|nr:aminotransferase class I/II-fold pyridoxal phosphate-dependent enzyme [Thermoplasmata archaeon]
MSEEPDRAPPIERRRRAPFDPLPEWVGPSTRLVHGARRPELNAGAVVPPIYQTSTYHFPEAFSEAAGHGGTYLYTRGQNPTQEVVAELLRGLEQGESCKVYASGMGALAAVLFSLAESGDEIVALDHLYGGMVDLLRWVGPRYGLNVRWVTAEEAKHPEAVVGEKTRIVFLESPTNPLLWVHDLAHWSKVADAAGALVVVDNTFATPINQRPLELGADLVVHSATKYLGGHADLIAGAVVGPRNLLDRIDPMETLGSVLDPFAAFLLARGLRTLALRVGRANENGTRLAAALENHPKVERVYYPGFGDPVQDEIARRQMSGRGGMVTLVIRGGAGAPLRFLRKLRLVHVAASLGSVESLASVPGQTSHRHLSAAALAARGIVPGLVRLSLGIEEPDDLVRDLTEALDAV